MINVQDLIQLKAFARQDGALTALLWTASFAFVVTGTGGSLGNLLMMATPFFVGWRLVKFRNYALGGAISLRRSLAYCLYTFLCAAVLFAVVQYVYFRFLDHGVFTTMFTQAMNALAPAYEQSGMSKADIKQTLDLVATLTPTQWTFVFMAQNVVLSLIACLPIALACMRRPGGRQNINLQNKE